MYLMFGDEADAEQGRGQKFFVYGAVFVDAENVEPLHDGIQDIRDKFGYGHTDSLKFSGCPKDVTYDAHREVKKQIVKLEPARRGVLRLRHFTCHCKRTNTQQHGPLRREHLVREIQ